MHIKRRHLENVFFAIATSFTADHQALSTPALKIAQADTSCEAELKKQDEVLFTKVNPTEDTKRELTVIEAMIAPFAPPVAELTLDQAVEQRLAIQAQLDCIARKEEVVESELQADTLVLFLARVESSLAPSGPLHCEQEFVPEEMPLMNPDLSQLLAQNTQ
jgi:hypothetical protein